MNVLAITDAGCTCRENAAARPRAVARRDDVEGERCGAELKVDMLRLNAEQAETDEARNSQRELV